MDSLAEVWREEFRKVVGHYAHCFGGQGVDAAIKRVYDVSPDGGTVTFTFRGGPPVVVEGMVIVRRCDNVIVRQEYFGNPATVTVVGDSLVVNY